MWQSSLSVLLVLVLVGEAGAQCRTNRICRQPTGRVVNRCLPRTPQRQIVYPHPTAVAGCCSTLASSRACGAAPSYLAGSPSRCPSTCGQVVNSPCQPHPAVIASNTTGCPCTGAPLAVGGATYSLSGHQQPDTGKIFPRLCEMIFLTCCSGGGTDCMQQYFDCAAVTGEPLRHAECPAAPEGP